MVDEEAWRSVDISETTEKREVELKVAARAVKESVNTMRHFLHRGSRKYGDGSVDVRVKWRVSAVCGVGHIEESGLGFADEKVLSGGACGYDEDVSPTTVSVLGVAMVL